MLFDFLSTSSNGCNMGSPRVVVQSLQRLIVTTLRGKSQRASSPPSCRATLPSDGRAHRQLFFKSPLFISLFFRFRLLRTLIIDHFVSLLYCGPSFSSAVPVGLGCGYLVTWLHKTAINTVCLDRFFYCHPTRRRYLNTNRSNLNSYFSS